ncbi:MAG TPA: lytic transglycosylase domain-containing protein, partial [Candidatus Polarisedimenticolia bacterium]|nr:lytic transglycosylase domain-containing protein [Candidatus Polarisedimenticolia bacterium]
MTRLGRAHRRAALACSFAIVAVALAVDAQAGIEAQVQGGDLVFTARPARKPGTVEPERRAAARKAREAPPGIDVLVKEVSDRYDMDPGLVTAVISVESGFDRLAVSPKGARGLMQLMPGTAKQYGVRDVHDARQNVEGGVAYLKDLIRAFDGDTRLAVAAYNAGPEAVAKASGVPAYRETQEYISKIEARYGRLTTSRGQWVNSPGAPTIARRVKAARDEGGVILLTNDPSLRSSSQAP